MSNNYMQTRQPGIRYTFKPPICHKCHKIWPYNKSKNSYEKCKCLVKAPYYSPVPSPKLNNQLFSTSIMNTGIPGNQKKISNKPGEYRKNFTRNYKLTSLPNNMSQPYPSTFINLKKNNKEHYKQHKIRSSANKIGNDMRSKKKSNTQIPPINTKFHLKQKNWSSSNENNKNKKKNKKIQSPANRIRKHINRSKRNTPSNTQISPKKQKYF